MDVSVDGDTLHRLERMLEDEVGHLGPDSWQGYEIVVVAGHFTTVLLMDNLCGLLDVNRLFVVEADL